ncbi:MAG: hypothetical protein IAI48_15080 [Candidatus Eremiobacteraeota bacterium]|nr:hypothetical protein [Candidatus Eremiobacteraeota bacterium]
MTIGYYGNLIRLILTTAFVTIVTGVAAFTLTANWIITIGASLAIATAFTALSAWRLRTSAAIHGFDRGRFTSTRLLTTCLTLIACAGTIGLEILAYALTQKRFAEALVVLVVGLPSYIILARIEFRAVTAPKPMEAGSQRTSLICFSVMFVIFVRNLLVQLKYPPEMQSELGMKVALAADMLVVAMFPVVLYFTYQRYRLAIRPANEIAA